MMSGPPTALLSALDDRDRQKLGEALRRLLANGSIFGLENNETELYHWSHQNQLWVEELCKLLGFRLFWDHPLRYVQAIPDRGDFLMRLKLDQTLVLLTLWWEFDTATRELSEVPPIRRSVQQLNDSLGIRFAPLRRQMPSQTRMREILALAQRKNLIRFELGAPFDQSQIDIFPTLKRVIPFQDLEEWAQYAERLDAGRLVTGSGEDSDLTTDILEGG